MISCVIVMPLSNDGLAISGQTIFAYRFLAWCCRSITLPMFYREHQPAVISIYSI